MVIFFNVISILDFDFLKKAADIFEFLKSKRDLVGVADVMIAAITIVNSQEIITRNIKHFNKIPNLVI